MRLFIFIFIICIIQIGNATQAQDICSSSIAGVTDENGQICIDVITPSVDPSIGFIIGTTYTINLYLNYSDPCTQGPGNCECVNIGWSTSSNITIIPSDDNCEPNSYDITITDGSLAIIEFSSTPQSIPQDPSSICNIQCTLYNRTEINATSIIPYTGICTELCPGIGLQSTGFEGVENGWLHKALNIDGNGTYYPQGYNSPEYTVIDGSTYNSFMYGASNTTFSSNQAYNPFTSTNRKTLALGHGDTRIGDNYYIISIEQTFFVGENYEPKLDIFYSWVTDVAPTQSLKSQPIFSIKLFRFYEDRDAGGNITFREEQVYSHISTENDYNEKTTTKAWKHWWDKQTIDLTPYKLERLRIEITSYDRKDDNRDYNSMAFVDISCSTCCTPSEVNTNTTQNLTFSNLVNGIVTITRPNKICETPNIVPIVAQRCTPNYFYQIIDPNGEPYVIESNVISVQFRPTIVGQYQIQYKEDVSCCWSDLQDFPVQGTIMSNNITFSNDLKSAAISCIPSFEMDEVLAVNVASFGDRQLVDPKDIVTSNRKAIASEVAVTEPKNPYLTGERGIWRTEASYAYVTDREGYETERNMNAVKEGGTFDLNMFNWTTQGVVPENWRRVNHVSRYDGYTHEIENRDILGRYSSALYGYNGQLATAVASNAAYYEIANEGFDAYSSSGGENVSFFPEICGDTKTQTGSPQTGWTRREVCIGPHSSNTVGNYDVELHTLVYEQGKKYAFHVLPIPCTNNGNAALAGSWSLANNPSVRIVYDNTSEVVIEILNDQERNFKLIYSGDGTLCGDYSVFPRLELTLPIKKSPDPIQTETNFEINNLYEDGDKDRNVILQVLWAKGEKGVLEGYTPGENSSVTLDASVLAYTIGKQGATDITPNLSVDLANNKYTIDEKVSITLTHRDATTSWFTLVAKDGYTLPEEWTQKDEQWYGSVRLARTLPPIGNTRNYQALTPIAHTGNQALSPSQDIIIQEKLLLIPNKEYVFSAWVKLSTSENQPYTYGTVVGAELSFYENGSNAAIQPVITINPTGAIIEGWQRIEGTFLVPTGSMFIGVKLTEPTSGAVYDDIRIYPANGMMKTYVYNPSNYLLQAVLDENNYATLYYYDEEQRLYLVQKETREGVQTIQETRSYIKPKE